MRLYAGAIDPIAYSLVVTLDLCAIPLDLTTVESVTVDTLRPDGSYASWSPSLSGQTKIALTLTYPYADGDLPIAGRYRPMVTLNTASGPVNVDAPVLDVFDPFS